MPEVNGTTYHHDTPQAVIDVLERSRLSGRRIRVSFGDTATGRDWQETFQVEGFVGRSMGPMKVPLLIYNRRSRGGGHMLDHCIVRIVSARGKYELYRHPLYHVAEEASHV